jgi:lipoate-protein ligase A
MLVDVNFEALQMAITPSAEKLAKHGVKSVRQRVMNLHDKNAELTTERMQNHLMSAFGTHTRDLSAEEITAIDEIEATYLDPLFIQGKESRR